ncbi:MAG: multicopper oxidase family protein [Nitrospirota bacterium]
MDCCLNRLSEGKIIPFVSLFILILLFTSSPLLAAKVEITLYATDTFKTMPDGKRIYMWGFTDDPKGEAKIPAPPIIVREGDDVYITLINKGMLKAIPQNIEPHTIHLHGIHVPTYYDGVPELSFSVPAFGTRFTYYFKANRPGTYMYHCHVQAPKHIQMGMYGALVVRPKKGDDYVYNDSHTKFDREYILVLSEIDSRWHKSVYDGGGKFNPIEFRPDYWLINGNAYPDTLSDPKTHIKTKTGERLLIRLISLGLQPHTMHLHGTHTTIIGRDAVKLRYPQEVFTVHISSGETYDLLVVFPDKTKISKEYKRVTRYPEKFPLHDHEDHRVTNNGVYPGGMLTIVEVDKP